METEGTLTVEFAGVNWDLEDDEVRLHPLLGQLRSVGPCLIV